MFSTALALCFLLKDLPCSRHVNPGISIDYLNFIFQYLRLVNIHSSMTKNFCQFYFKNCVSEILDTLKIIKVLSQILLKFKLLGK